jgi:hypothetical protein
MKSLDNILQDFLKRASGMYEVKVAQPVKRDVPDVQFKNARNLSREHEEVVSFFEELRKKRSE